METQPDKPWWKWHITKGLFYLALCPLLLCLPQTIWAKFIYKLMHPRSLKGLGFFILFLIGILLFKQSVLQVFIVTFTIIPAINEFIQANQEK